MKDNR